MQNTLKYHIRPIEQWTSYLQLNEVKLSYYGVAIHLLSGFWSVFRTETSLTHWILIGSLPNQKKWIKQLKDYMYTKFHNDPTKTLGVIGILVQSSCATRPAGRPGRPRRKWNVNNSANFQPILMKLFEHIVLDLNSWFFCVQSWSVL